MRIAESKTRFVFPFGHMPPSRPRGRGSSHSIMHYEMAACNQYSVSLLRRQRTPSAHLAGRHLDKLLNWLKTTDGHPLIASCIFHCEFEFIHPCDDSSGRIGRLWQTLILNKWRPVIRGVVRVSTLLDKKSLTHMVFMTYSATSENGSKMAYAIIKYLPVQSG